MDTDKCEHCSMEVVRHSLRAIIDTVNIKVDFVCMPCYEKHNKKQEERSHGKS